MNIATAIIGTVLGIFAVLAIFALMRRGTEDDMIARQKRETSGLLDNAPRPKLTDNHRPTNVRSDVQAVLAVPQIRAAIEAGRKIEAIKLVREANGMGLKQARQLVEMAAKRL